MCWFTAACLFVSFLCDVGVWRCVGDLRLYQEGEKGDLQLYQEGWKEGKSELQEMQQGQKMEKSNAI